MDSLKGQLLIAVPHLPDENFFRSVVLIIQHSEEGASGLVLNRPSEIQLEDIWAEVSSTPLSRNMPIHIGGPVQGPLVALHDQTAFSETTIIPRLFISLQREHLDQLLTGDDGCIRIFSGYSGWGPGQLENELQVGGWLTTPAEFEHVFAEPADLWKAVCEQFGQDILFMESGRAKIPDDPSLN